MAPLPFRRRNAAPKSKPSKFASKRAGLKSKSKMPRKPRSKVVVRQQNLGQQTESRQMIISKGDPRSKFMKAVAIPQFYEFSLASRIDAPNPGQQTWGQVFMSNQATLATIGLVNQNNQGLTANPSIGRYLLENANTEVTFQNFSTAPAHLKIYTVRVKRDTWVPPAVVASPQDQMVFANALGTKYYWQADPISAIREGLNAASNTTPGATNVLNDPASVPTQSLIYKTYFATTMTQDIYLAQGGSHTFRLTRKYDKVVDGSITQNTALVGIGGVTEYIVFSVVGGVAAQVTGGAATVSEGHIGIVQTQKYRSTNLLGNLSNLTETNYLPQTGPVGIVNPGSGGSGVVAYV